jgi:murein DD-endopeptidase MepM/ murein hydrolase activator NlpD
VIDPTYPYASTRNGELEVHHGVEFVNSSGTPVIAANDGTVVYAGNDAAEALGPYLGFYGNVVIIKHTSLYFGEDIYTLYAHLSQIDVEENEQVDLGQVIGKVGATGAALGSHLHFEVRVGINEESHTVNPILWFAPLAQADGEIMAIVAGRILDRNGQPVEALQLSFEKLGNDGKVEAYYYPITYHLSGVNYHPELNENFVVPDIPPGQYRLAFVYGRLYEFFFTIEAGNLGFLTIPLD